MPSVPIVTPSEMATVLTSIGVPPAARMPSITYWASRRRPKLHGIVSIQEWATPTIGLLEIVVLKSQSRAASRGRRRGPGRHA